MIKYICVTGNLVRSILYPPPVDFRFEKDSYKFVGFLGFVACFGFIYTLITKVNAEKLLVSHLKQNNFPSQFPFQLINGDTIEESILKATDLISITVPPALPAAMSVGRFYAQRRLQKLQIYCISPRTINVSGSINCVCFDKTGTLTEDGLDLLCVVPIEERRVKPAVKQVETIPFNKFYYGLASCHSLTIIDNELVGDPMDQKVISQHNR